MTGRQKACYDFIAAYQSATGIGPTFDEMKRGIGLKSKSGIHRLVSALERDGHILRRRFGARAIYIPTLDERLPADIRATASRLSRARGLSVEAVIRSALLHFDRQESSHVV